jgi:hypothetical protein
MQPPSLPVLQHYHSAPGGHQEHYAHQLITEIFREQFSPFCRVYAYFFSSGNVQNICENLVFENGLSMVYRPDYKVLHKPGNYKECSSTGMLSFMWMYTFRTITEDLVFVFQKIYVLKAKVLVRR